MTDETAENESTTESASPVDVTVMCEPAPGNNLPDWSECALRVDNSEYIEKRISEGGYGFEEDGYYANELHKFIHEYDDSDPYKSAWFLHRLEKLIEFVKSET